MSEDQSFESIQRSEPNGNASFQGRFTHVKMFVNTSSFPQSSHTLQYLLPVLSVQVYIVQLSN